MCLWTWGSFALYYSFKKQNWDYPKGTWCSNDSVKKFLSQRATSLKWLLCQRFYDQSAPLQFPLQHGAFPPCSILEILLHYYSIFALSPCSNAVLTLGILPEPWVSWMDFVIWWWISMMLLIMQMLAWSQAVQRGVPTCFLECCLLIDAYSCLWDSAVSLCQL